mmetsp:Transcript_67941/g.100803  ORF Transcript_67941/g.100803 Transcript_67941/m.100803 type:complete len:509 (-) Transcript_67941:81-1607(-)
MDLKCPPGVDESIFLSLPPDVKLDVVAQYNEQQPRESRSDVSRDEKSSARTPDKKSPKKNTFPQGTGVIGAVLVGPDNDTAEYVINRKMKSSDQRVNAKLHATAAVVSPLQHAMSPHKVEVEEEQSSDLPFGGELDPEMLAALPEDIRREVIESYWEEQERKTKSAKDKSFVEPLESKVSTPSSSVTSSIQTSHVCSPRRSGIETRPEEDAYSRSRHIINPLSRSDIENEPRRSRHIISPLSQSDLENEPSLKKPPTIDRNIAFPLSASVAQSAVCRRPEPTPMETMKCKYVGGYDERRRRSGKGELRWENGDTFRGLFADGLRCGPGTLKLHDGSSYEGNWKNDQYDGYGVRKFPNGYIYAGMFQNGRFYGHGRCDFPNGDSYEGDWIDGLMEGLGKYIHKVNGDIYEGMYLAGKRDGPGRYRHRNRRTDIVHYVNNKRMGEGVRWSKDGKKAWLLQGKEVMGKLSKESAIKLQDKICGSHIKILEDNLTLIYRPVHTPPRTSTTRY